MKMQFIAIAGDSGVYAGWATGGVDAVSADGRVELWGARHLRRYYVAGRVGSGSVGDLAVRGLDAESPSISEPLAGPSVLLGVRRAFAVAPSAIDSFGCPYCDGGDGGER